MTRYLHPIGLTCRNCGLPLTDNRKSPTGVVHISTGQARCDGRRIRDVGYDTTRELAVAASGQPTHRGTPKPPPEIWDELTAAHDSGDPTRIQIAEERTHAWAVENGYEHPKGRPARADEAAR